MTSRRDEMLREMGLAPTWRLRGGRSLPTGDDVEATSVESEAPITTAEAPPVSDPSPRYLVTSPGDRRAAIMRMDWPALKEAVAKCLDCPLHAKRNKTVFGVGDENADWMFVGEGPGADEDVQGEPFVGQAGKLLDSMLAAIDLKRGENVYIANTVKCLSYNALVQLGDQSWERIGRLVSARYAGEVMSVDASGALVKRRVVGWHASPLAGRQVFRLSYASLKAAGLSKACIQLTGDHPVLTQRGWVAVAELQKGDSIATGQGLSDVAFDVVCGTLLGDGHIHARSSHLGVGHTLRHAEYLWLKAQLLDELACSVEERFVAARVGEPRAYAIARLRTRAHRALAILRTQFYRPVKCVPTWLETGLNARMLAFWFMDDGYMRIRTNRRPRAEIATCAFSDDDIQVLLRGLFNLGLRAKALRGRIYFDADESRRLAELIAPFVPPCMRYKLHSEVAQNVPYDAERFVSRHTRALYDEVEVSPIVHEGTDKTFYCLDVADTHNFVTSGGVVHNCRPPGNRNPAPEEALKCEPFLQRQIELIKPKLIVALGRVAAVNLLGRDVSVASLRGRVLDYNGTPLIVTYHPAYLLRSLTEKAKAWEDLCFAVKTMQGLQAAGNAAISVD
jgi:uracil-DNA glycosylase